MTPGARVQAAIEVLDSINEGTPAEKALTGWARRSRFAGSGDRAAVRDHVFQALRCWRSCAALGGGNTGRALMLGALRAQGAEVEAIFSGEGHAPTVLSDEERTGGAPPQGDGERLDLPDWVAESFRQDLGEDAEAAALILRERAPVMLRVNLAKSTIPSAIEALAQAGIEATSSNIAEGALVVKNGARKVSGSEPYQGGLVELQDGSSQAAMALLELPEGGRILDYCAGGGGKVLAMAGRCRAQWFAHDALPQRMKDLPDRAARAGVEVHLCEVGEPEGLQPFDLVLCDVPCSGSGAWRRTPDAKWRFTPERLVELVGLQEQILQSAAGLVGNNGLLAYATCSVLKAENEERIAAFLKDFPDWQLVDQRRWPVGDVGDGFFLAQLQRVMRAELQS